MKAIRRSSSKDGELDGHLTAQTGCDTSPPPMLLLNRVTDYHGKGLTFNPETPNHQSVEIGAKPKMASQIEFWRLPTVMQKTGLSKSEIYRRISDNRFPKSRRYPDSDKCFWLSRDVVEWQLETLGIETICE